MRAGGTRTEEPRVADDFKTLIANSGAKTFITIPFDPNEVWGVKQRHYITGTINGVRVRGPLESDGEQYLLRLGAAWRRGLDLEAGAKVDVILSPEGPQTDYVNWVESAKRPETRTNRINEMIELLKAGKKQK